MTGSNTRVQLSDHGNKIYTYLSSYNTSIGLSYQCNSQATHSSSDTIECNIQTILLAIIWYICGRDKIIFFGLDDRICCLYATETLYEIKDDKNKIRHRLVTSRAGTPSISPDDIQIENDFLWVNIEGFRHAKFFSSGRIDPALEEMRRKPNGERVDANFDVTTQFQHTRLKPIVHPPILVSEVIEKQSGKSTFRSQWPTTILTTKLPTLRRCAQWFLDIHKYIAVILKAYDHQDPADHQGLLLGAEINQKNISKACSKFTSRCESCMLTLEFVQRLLFQTNPIQDTPKELNKYIALWSDFNVDNFDVNDRPKNIIVADWYSSVCDDPEAIFHTSKANHFLDTGEDMSIYRDGESSMVTFDRAVPIPRMWSNRQNHIIVKTFVDGIKELSNSASESNSNCSNIIQTNAGDRELHTVGSPYELMCSDYNGPQGVVSNEIAEIDTQKCSLTDSIWRGGIRTVGWNTGSLNSSIQSADVRSFISKSIKDGIFIGIETRTTEYTVSGFMAKIQSDAPSFKNLWNEVSLYHNSHKSGHRGVLATLPNRMVKQGGFKARIPQFDNDGRVLCFSWADTKELLLIAYFPNALHDEETHSKRRLFDDKLLAFLDRNLEEYPRFVLHFDGNGIHEDRDAHNGTDHTAQNCRPVDRYFITTFLNKHPHTQRVVNDETGVSPYTWFQSISNARAGMGQAIDYTLVHQDYVIEKPKFHSVFATTRGDHIPIEATIKPRLPVSKQSTSDSKLSSSLKSSTSNDPQDPNCASNRSDSSRRQKPGESHPEKLLISPSSPIESSSSSNENSWSSQHYNDVTCDIVNSDLITKPTDSARLNTPDLVTLLYYCRSRLELSPCVKPVKRRTSSFASSTDDYMFSLTTKPSGPGLFHFYLGDHPAHQFYSDVLEDKPCMTQHQLHNFISQNDYSFVVNCDASRPLDCKDNVYNYNCQDPNHRSKNNDPGKADEYCERILYNALHFYGAILSGKIQYGNILVSCLRGKNRSACFIALLRLLLSVNPAQDLENSSDNLTDWIHKTRSGSNIRNMIPESLVNRIQQACYLTSAVISQIPKGTQRGESKAVNDFFTSDSDFCEFSVFREGNSFLITNQNTEQALTAVIITVKGDGNCAAASAAECYNKIKLDQNPQITAAIIRDKIVRLSRFLIFQANGLKNFINQCMLQDSPDPEGAVNKVILAVNKVRDKVNRMHQSGDMRTRKDFICDDLALSDYHIEEDSQVRKAVENYLDSMATSGTWFNCYEMQLLPFVLDAQIVIVNTEDAVNNDFILKTNYHEFIKPKTIFLLCRTGGNHYDALQVIEYPSHQS